MKVLVAGATGAMGRQPDPLLDQLRKTDPLRERPGRQKPRVRDQILLGEAHRHPTQLMRCSHLSDAISCDCRLIRRKTNPQATEGICTFTARRTPH